MLLGPIANDPDSVARADAVIGVSHALPRAVALLADLSIPRRAEMQQFAARLGGQDAPPLVGNKHFWCSDYITHHRPGWFTSVKMFSTRMFNAELVNNEGMRSQHLSDGANFIYLTGDEYLDIFPVWDWNKIPGTTVEQAPPSRDELKVKGKTSFVGGVSD